MPARVRFLFLTMNVTLFFVAAVPLYQELSRRKDIWWTPRAMLVSLAESADRVEIYARGRPLAALVQAGQVRITEDARTSELTPHGARVPELRRGTGATPPAPNKRVKLAARLGY